MKGLRRLILLCALMVVSVMAALAQMPTASLLKLNGNISCIKVYEQRYEIKFDERAYTEEPHLIAVYYFDSLGRACGTDVVEDYNETKHYSIDYRYNEQGKLVCINEYGPEIVKDYARYCRDYNERYNPDPIKGDWELNTPDSLYHMIKLSTENGVTKAREFSGSGDFQGETSPYNKVSCYEDIMTLQDFLSSTYYFTLHKQIKNIGYNKPYVLSKDSQGRLIKRNSTKEEVVRVNNTMQKKTVPCNFYWYTYNAQGRLSQLTSDWKGNRKEPNQNVCYSYDERGNISKIYGNIHYWGYGWKTVEYTYKYEYGDYSSPNNLTYSKRKIIMDSIHAAWLAENLAARELTQRVQAERERLEAMKKEKKKLEKQLDQDRKERQRLQESLQSTKSQLDKVSALAEELGLLEYVLQNYKSFPGEAVIRYALPDKNDSKRAFMVRYRKRKDWVAYDIKYSYTPMTSWNMHILHDKSIICNDNFIRFVIDSKEHDYSTDNIFYFVERDSAGHYTTHACKTFSCEETTEIRRHSVCENISINYDTEAKAIKAKEDMQNALNRTEADLNRLTASIAYAESRIQELDQQIKRWDDDFKALTSAFDNRQDMPVETFVSREAEFPGGREALSQYLSDHIQYPEEARQAGIEGKVYLEFVVEMNGSLSNVVIKRDIGGGCGQEAVRVVEAMPRWLPGELNGKIVRSRYTLPVVFRYQ